MSILSLRLMTQIITIGHMHTPTPMGPMTPAQTMLLAAGGLTGMAETEALGHSMPQMVTRSQTPSWWMGLNSEDDKVSRC